MATQTIPTFPVSLDSVGLPSGDNWSLSLTGPSNHTVSGNSTLWLANGTYTYVATATGGFIPANSSGQFKVNGIPRDFLENVSGYTNVQGVLSDPYNGLLYLANTSGRLFVLNATNSSLIANLSIGSGAFLPLLSPDTKTVYVVNELSSSVSVINASTNKLKATIRVGGLPWEGAIDPVGDRLYVPNSQDDNISVISLANNTVVDSFSTNLTPVTVVPLPDRQELYVVCQGFVGQPGKLMVVNTTDDSVTKVLNVSSNDIEGGVYDPTLRQVFLADSEHGKVIIVNTTTASVFRALAFPTIGSPWYPTFDPRNGLLYFASTGDSRLGVFDPTSREFVGSLNLSGHPSMTSFDAKRGGVWIPLYWGPPRLNLLDGNPMEVRVAFVPAPPPTFPVWFNESGLPNGTAWSVTVNGTSIQSSAGSIRFDLANGTEEYSVGPIAGWRSNLSSGSILVSGAAAYVFVHWTPNVYGVVFDEHGLPSGTDWGVTINASTNRSSAPSIGFSLPNGTFQFNVSNVAGWRLSVYYGTVVVNGSAVVQDLNWSQTQYEVVFQESGLPTALVWAVTVNGTTGTSNSSQIEFNLPNGTDLFSVRAPAGYNSSPDSGVIAIIGSPVTKNVLFIEAVSTARPMTVRAWGNLTAYGGGGAPQCPANGSLGAGPSWANVSFQAKVANGTPPYSFVWDFGDGTPNVTGASVEHHFNSTSWTVAVRVSDAKGVDNSTSLQGSAPAVPSVLAACPAAGPSLPGTLVVVLALALAGTIGASAILLRRRGRRTQASPHRIGGPDGADPVPSDEPVSPGGT